MNILNKKAFTLIEILVTLFVFSIICVIASEFLVNGFKSTKFNEEQEAAIKQARDGMEEITRTIRGASFSENGDYILSITDQQEIEFYADVDYDSIMEKVRYYVNGNRLERGVIKPGIDNLYNLSAEISLVADYLNNQSEPIFEYYNSNRQITNIRSEIKSINIRLKINVTPHRAPNDYILESDVQLRNLKDF